MTRLEVDGVTMRFGGVVALHDVSLAVPEAGIRGVIGPNGAGKTSLLNVISGVHPPRAGRVLLDGSPISGMRADAIAARGVQRTFQSTMTFAGMTVLENVMTGLAARYRCGALGAALGTRAFREEEREAATRSRQSLDFVEMGAFAEAEAASLSFGQQRLVEIARALVSRPRVLLLDEPAVGLNVLRIDALDRLLRRIRTEQGITIVMIEHVLRLVMNVCDEVTVLSTGRVIAEGTPAAVTADAAVQEAYLGAQLRAERAAA